MQPSNTPAALRPLGPEDTATEEITAGLSRPELADGVYMGELAGWELTIDGYSKAFAMMYRGVRGRHPAEVTVRNYRVVHVKI